MKTQSLLDAVLTWEHMAERNAASSICPRANRSPRAAGVSEEADYLLDGWVIILGFVLWLIHKDEEPTLKSLLDTSEAFSYWTHLQYELLNNTQYWENWRQFFQENAEREMTQRRSPGYFCEDELQANLEKRSLFNSSVGLQFKAKRFLILKALFAQYPIPVLSGQSGLRAEIHTTSPVVTSHKTTYYTATITRLM